MSVVFRRAYRLLTDEEKARIDAIKVKAGELHELVAALGQTRELSLAKTKIEEAVMWAVKHATQ